MTELIPTGQYRARITDQGYREAGTGTPQFFLEFVLIAMVHDDGIEEDCPRVTRTYRKALTEKAFPYLVEDLNAIDVEFGRPSQLDPQVEDAIKLIDREIRVHCEHTTYEGKDREEWNLLPRKAPVAKMSLDKVRDLDRQFGRLLSTQSRASAAVTYVHGSDQEN